MIKTILIFSALVTAVILLIGLSEYSINSNSGSKELMVSVVAVLFIVMGYYLSVLFKTKHPSLKPNEEIDKRKLTETGLSDREYEIFLLMAKGLSNSEIGNQLFISEYTVKSHVSKIFMKLNARRRTQAIQIGRELNIIP